ncbi:hypothetical protein ACE38V_15875 [Cytobacillus sp. Hz8]|uniref:hypothetical protein n=1 Tax=Cytobacillus sp. Hz8 TaxID=3347168 RepID=UPI0035DE1313
MNQEQIENVFEHMGYVYFREKFPFKLWLNGILDEEDEEFFLSFLDVYRLEDDDAYCFDEFLYLLRIYQYICKHNDLPVFYF